MSDFVKLSECTEILNERLNIHYSAQELQMYRLQKKEILCQIEQKKLKLGRKPPLSPIYNNQKNCGNKVVEQFKDKKKILVLVYGKTQSGKTGCMVAVIQEYLNDEHNFINKENIYIITGLSSKDWVKQTTLRFPEAVRDRIFHLPQLKEKNDLERFSSDIKMKKNVLIIMDEIQIAAMNHQSVYKAFKEAGLYDVQNLLQRDVKIVEFSATPGGTLYDCDEWGEHSMKMPMEPGEGYVSAYDLLKKNKVLQYKDLYCYKTIKNKDTKKREKIFDKKEFERNMKEVLFYMQMYVRDPKYHIFRTQTAKHQKIQIKQMEKYFQKHKVDVICNYTYDGGGGENNIKNINSVLETKPTINTIICIKEKLRCANTLTKPNLGILYERWTKTKQDDVIMQGIVGRATGYDGFDGVVFTNIDSIDRFEKRFNSGFEDRSIPWKTKTTGKNGKRKSTFNSPSNIAGMKGSVIDQFVKKKRKVIMKSFNKEELAKEYVKNKFGKKGMRDQSVYLNKNGFYMSTVGEIKDKVWSWKEMEIEAQRRPQINKSTGYICRRSYVDINDKDSILFTICHY